MWLDWAVEDEFGWATADGQFAPGLMNNSRIDVLPAERTRDSPPPAIRATDPLRRGGR